MRPETRYAKSGDVNIAYQVVGDGPLDLVYVPGWISNVELMWEEPAHAQLLGRLASFSRLILFDNRGTGLSDPVPLDRLPTLEQRMDDVRAVMDAADSERAAIFGSSEGGLMSVLFAATSPERIEALITLAIYATRLWSADYPWAPTPEARAAEIEEIEWTWGGEMDISTLAPSADDPCADARPPARRRPRRKRRGGPVDRAADSGREVRRAARRRAPDLGRGRRCGGGRGRGVPHRPP